MQQLTIQDVINHCERQCDKHEKLSEHYEQFSLENNKLYQEHYLTKQWLQELQHYKSLEEHGLLLKLPCREGDTVYEIEGVRWIGDRNWQYPSYKDAYVKETEFTLKKYDMLGLNYFLTKEEAEKKIAERIQEAKGEQDGKIDKKN